MRSRPARNVSSIFGVAHAGDRVAGVAVLRQVDERATAEMPAIDQADISTTAVNGASSVM